jgi:superfamily II DNA or RNA helicase
MKLRHYQEEGVKRIREKFKEGKKRVIFQLSTGGGKSLIFTHMAVNAVRNGKTVLIIADRKELIGQAKRHLQRVGVTPMVVDPKWKGQMSSCYVASVQTLNRRNMPEADLVLIDEAHINAFSRVLSNHIYDHSFIVGFTATPISTPKFDLSKLYHDMVEVIQIDELINEGFLVNAKFFGAWENLGKLKMKGDDYDPDELFQKFDNKKMYDGMIEAYKQHTPNTKAICFCINVEHTIRTCEQFNQHGIKAVFVVSDPQLCSDQQRDFAIQQFELGEAMVMVNQGILTKGYDHPAIETVILNRKTKSLALYLQMIGRGSRPFKDKMFFNVLDMGSNILEHGWYDEPRVWDLKPKRKASNKKGLAPIKECLNPTCGCLIPAVSKVCKFCGFVFPEDITKLATSEGIVEIVKEALPQIPTHLLNKGFSKMSIEELELIREIKKYKIGWMVHHLEERGAEAWEQYRKLKDYKHGWDKYLRKQHRS